MTSINPQKYYSVKELVALGGEGFLPFSSGSTIQSYIKDGRLKTFRESGKGIKPRYMVKGEDLLMFIESSSSLEIQNVNRRPIKEEEGKSKRVSQKRIRD